MDHLLNFSYAAQERATALIRQYGDDAEVIATMQAAEFAAIGDVEALAAWDEIIACICAMTSDISRSPSASIH